MLVGCMQIGKMSLKGAQLQLFPKMLPHKLSLFGNPLIYIIYIFFIKIYTQYISIIVYLYSHIYSVV